MVLDVSETLSLILRSYLFWLSSQMLLRFPEPIKHGRIGSTHSWNSMIIGCFKADKQQRQKQSSPQGVKGGETGSSYSGDNMIIGCFKADQQQRQKCPWLEELSKNNMLNLTADPIKKAQLCKQKIETLILVIRDLNTECTLSQQFLWIKLIPSQDPDL